MSFVLFLYFCLSDVKQMWYLYVYVLNVSSSLLIGTFQTCLNHVPASMPYTIVIFKIEIPALKSNIAKSAEIPAIGV